MIFENKKFMGFMTTPSILPEMWLSCEYEDSEVVEAGEESGEDATGEGIAYLG